MTDKARPVFVARRTYRQRRMADAARLLPVLGAGLFLVPLLWRSDGASVGEGDAVAASGAGTVEVMLYLFLVWIFLAAAAGLISYRLPAPQDETRRDGQG
ncbi:hypothetical protein [Roseovarius aestuariivivens]|uniref:hypothetical protein n=1 Tax=Roseovarius aestuariivivens TaxID=1888910 RepID=UPI001081C2B3|nr:hypothetical protein [Roseovarius aestuariivivens]